ncbi:MAG: helix-turn-helix transcriptional regulator [Elusimicrobia bacterium]|nr:helix-turn-helix transcriptional regulator [Elusimicrobiota bacterium]
MQGIKTAREQRHISQRRLAKLAGVSFRSVQLLESKKHNPTLVTLKRVAKTLGYCHQAVDERLESIFAAPSDSIVAISQQIAQEGEGSWKLWFFNFVDAFRRDRHQTYVESPPVERTPQRIKALLASGSETLCDEIGLTAPWWCAGVGPLNEPWFVSGLDSLKPSVLIESPVHFRKRNIFVLKNFLKRA